MTQSNEEESMPTAAQYRKKPVVVEATQWFKNGDHPLDRSPTFLLDGKWVKAEGKIVRYYRHPSVDGQSACGDCGRTMHDHGWIDSGGEGRTVCPGDFIVTEPTGQFVPCKPDAFAATYDPWTPAGA